MNCHIALLGIQPKANGVGEVVSLEVKAAITQVVDELFTVLSSKNLQDES